MSKPKSEEYRTPLLPLRNMQGDFFVCDIFDAAPKGDMASMAHPLFTLSTKPDRTIRKYENGTDYLQLAPSAHGLATVHDRDILIYCISQVMSALNDGKKISRTLRFKAYDLLKATNRMTNGRGYEGLKSALERLRGTTISTNITSGGLETTEIFGFIDKSKIIRETRDGRMLDLEVTLSDWIFNAIEGKEVLTLNRDYFRLRKPLERRIYEIARKLCGQRPSFKIGIEKLQNRTGSQSKTYEFKRLLTNIIRDGNIPDYDLELEADILTITPKAEFTLTYGHQSSQMTFVHLKGDTYTQAKKHAQGWDVYHIEQEWRDWSADKDKPKNPDSAFIAFLKKWVAREGAARS